MSIEGNSTPSFTEFNPSIVPYQLRVSDDVDAFDYSLGAHEVLLSGSVGSAKSILMAHLVVRHCVENDRARACLGRKSMPDLKETILALVLEHLEGDFIEGVDYIHNETKGKIIFKNGSEIISRSWADRKYKKARSLRLSMAVFEELTENDTQDKEAYDEIKMRVGRLPHIKQNLIISATNPDSPRHWAYKYFILSDSKTRHVYYSKTEENPFLPKQYIEQLKTDLDEKMARRMLHGEWIEIQSESIYYAYNRERNYIDAPYKINPSLPIGVTFDFNIGEGKPFSACCFQYDGNAFHVFKEIIIQGARTLDACDELANSGILDMPHMFKVYGDATGRARSTKSLHSDYDLITKFFSNYNSGRLRWELCVPRDNPPIRERHNMVNAYCYNAHKQVRLFVYHCPTVDEGLRLTSFKKGGALVEDDSNSYQHVTTALGYAMVYIVRLIGMKAITSEAR